MATSESETTTEAACAGRCAGCRGCPCYPRGWLPKEAILQEAQASTVQLVRRPLHSLAPRRLVFRRRDADAEWTTANLRDARCPDGTHWRRQVQPCSADTSRMEYDQARGNARRVLEVHQRVCLFLNVSRRQTSIYSNSTRERTRFQSAVRSRCRNRPPGVRSSATRRLGSWPHLMKRLQEASCLSNRGRP